jgi:ERO1-like protein beta
MLSQCVEIAHAQLTLLKMYNPSGLLCSLSKEEIPEIWRASILGKVTGPIATHPSPLPTRPHPEDAATTAPLGGALGEDAAEMCIFERNGYDSERDYCIPEDESGTSGGVYVSLVANPERYTGYSGDHTQAIWREIYSENCFEIQPQDAEEEARLSKSHYSQSEAKNDLEAIMLGRSKGRRTSGATLTKEHNYPRLDNTCLEKRVFWRLISGMHTSISTHLCWDYLNQTTGEWVRHMCFLSNIRDQTSNVLSPVCGIILNGSRICISTTSLFFALSQNYPVT